VGPQTEGRYNPLNSYELVFITIPSIEDERMTAILDKISGIITSGSGRVESVDDWGMRRLTFSIKKVNEGRYTLMNFECAPSLIAALERQIRLIQEVIRYVVVKKGE
jgi:small subunit ribosomal protein S6